MKWSVILLLGLLGLALPAQAADRALGSVQTHDDQTRDGALRFDGDHVIVQRDDGTQTRLPLSQVRRIRFQGSSPTPGATPVGDAPLIQPPAADVAQFAGGLKAEYFADADFRQLNLIRTDATASFDWTSQMPDPSFRAREAFSVRWTGRLRVDRAGGYRFIRESDLRLWLDGQPVLIGSTANALVQLGVGQHELKIEASFPEGKGLCVLYWMPPEGGRQPIPPSCLSLPLQDPRLPPVVAILAGETRRFNVMSESIPLSAAAASRNHQAVKVDFIENDRVLASAAQPPYVAWWKPQQPGLHLVRARATDADNMTALSPPVQVIVAGDGQGTLPSSWGEFTVGSVGAAGMARFDHGSFTLTKSGGDPWSQEDSMGLAVRLLRGDGQIVARITALSSSEASVPANGGLAIRGSLSDESHRVTLLLQQGAGAGLVTRGGKNPLFNLPRQPEPLPCWLKLVRSGDDFRAYKSADGRSWESVGTSTVPMGQTVFVALAAAAHHDQATATAVFDQVSVSDGLPMETSASGVLLRNGTLLAGAVTALNGDVVRLRASDGQVQSLPLKDVARLLYQPVPADAAAQVAPGQTGLLLSSGDFLQGTLRTVNPERLEIESVLFGIRSFPLRRDVAAVILADLAPPPPWQITLIDGSILAAQSIRAENQQLTALDQSAETRTVPLALVREIHRRASPSK